MARRKRERPAADIEHPLAAVRRLARKLAEVDTALIRLAGTEHYGHATTAMAGLCDAIKEPLAKMTGALQADKYQPMAKADAK